MARRYVAVCDDCGLRSVHVDRGGAARELRRHPCEIRKLANAVDRGDYAVTWTPADGFRLHIVKAAA